MIVDVTRDLLDYQQETCAGIAVKSFVVPFVMGTSDVDTRRKWLVSERERLGLSPSDLAKRAQPLADKDGYQVKFNQQLIWNFENGGKKIPGWWKYAVEALAQADDATDDGDRIANEDEVISDAVLIEALPTFVGAGGGGTGEGEIKPVAFSRGLIEALQVDPGDLLAIEIEGDSMEPSFRPGDQLLIDKRKTNTAQPGAFCLWDGDGYVIKYLERIAGSQPPSVRVISENSRYTTQPRLVDEIRVMGRVVWLGRRI